MQSRDELVAHVQGLFRQAPPSRAAIELREEVLADALERYDDLVAGGMSPADACASVAGNIGNVGELLRALPREDGQIPNEVFEQERRERRALLTTISVGLYILAGVVFFTGGVLSEYWGDALAYAGLLLAGVICIAPTCILVYQHNLNKREAEQAPPAPAAPEPPAERTGKEKEADKGPLAAVSSSIWTIATLVFLALGFFFHAWHPGWMVFILAAGVEGVLAALLRSR